MRHNSDRVKGTKAILQGQHIKTIVDLRPSIKTKRNILKPTDGIGVGKAKRSGGRLDSPEQRPWAAVRLTLAEPGFEEPYRAGILNFTGVQSRDGRTTGIDAMSVPEQYPANAWRR